MSTTRSRSSKAHWTQGFLRIHRSTLVNTAWIKEVTTLPGGGLNLRLKDANGTDVTVSRDRAREFKTRLLVK